MLLCVWLSLLCCLAASGPALSAVAPLSAANPVAEGFAPILRPGRRRVRRLAVAVRGVPPRTPACVVWWPGTSRQSAEGTPPHAQGTPLPGDGLTTLSDSRLDTTKHQ